MTARTDTSIEIQLEGGEKESWEILKLNAFSSERKRMSIVVKNTITGQIMIYVKVNDDNDDDGQ